MVTRREWLRTAAGAVAAGVVGPRAATAAEGPTSRPVPIDRRAVVGRHAVVRTRSRPGSPLQVGNGSVAFGADVTGLQTFVPFNTLAQWAWYTAPLPSGQTVADLAWPTWDAHGRPVPYDTGDPTHRQLTAWSFANPTRVNVARVGLTLARADGTPAVESDLTDVRQELDLWTGTLTSRFTLDGQPVTVTTACHPEQDVVAVRVASPAVAAGRVAAFVDFPVPDGRQLAGAVGTFAHADRFPVEVTGRQAGRIDLRRAWGEDVCHTAVTWAAGADLRRRGEGANRQPQVNVSRARYGTDGKWADVTAVVAARVAHGDGEVVANTPTLKVDPAPYIVKQLEVTYTVDGVERTDRVPEHATWTLDSLGGPNRLTLTGTGGLLAFTVAFSPAPLPAQLPDAEATVAAAAEHWPWFWQTGGAIDLSASHDARWHELERRIVLSQYLMAVNEAGAWPPQESGLVNTGWFGKFHMEMYWWHAAHYALWDRWPLLDRSLDVYRRMLPSARERAARQGYAGARWTKMTGPDGRNASFITNAMLVWQQPHPMFFAELDYRAHPTPATLDKWRDVLFATADFMAAYPFWDGKRFVLGPPMAVVSENTNDRVTINPTFELGYWRFGLRIAQTWRQRLGLPPDPGWDHVLRALAPLPVEDGVYVTYEGIADMWAKHNYEHPGLTGAFGWLPGDGVDPAVMRATLDRVLARWRMDAVWGWDFPMMAMCAARLGQPDQAVDLLLTASAGFQFDDAGLATGGPFPYFPSNGGLLYAVAMMAAGWDGGPARPAPGFPDPAADGGRWVVRAEGLRPAL